MSRSESTSYTPIRLDMATALRASILPPVADPKVPPELLRADPSSTPVASISPDGQTDYWRPPKLPGHRTSLSAWLRHFRDAVLSEGLRIPVPVSPFPGLR